MNLISFNIDDKLLDKKSYKLIKNKKKILYNPACQNNIFFDQKNKYSIAEIHDIQKNRNAAKKIKYIENCYYILLKFISKKLNKAHNKNYSKDFWGILIGKWLYTLVFQSFLNWETLIKIKKKYKTKNFVKINLDPKKLIPENTWHSHFLLRGQSKYNLYQHWLIASMLEKKYMMKEIKVNLEKNIDLEKEIKLLSTENLIVDNIFYKSINDKIFYHQWDVPPQVKYNMMKYFKFIKFKTTSKKINTFKPAALDRSKIFKIKSQKMDFLTFIKSNFQFTCPKIFLEYFYLLENLYLKLNWPKKPRYILTMYPYFDDFFKYYCARSNQNGAKILITQHGYDNIFKHDNWGVNKVFSKTQLSWGENNKKNLKNFIFTKIYKFKKTNFKSYNNRRILIILYAFSEVETQPPDGYNRNYLMNVRIYKSTLNFLNKINKNLINLVDLKALQLTKFPILENSIRKKHKNINFISIKKSFKKIINNYNVSVHFFLGTPFFESIYLNRPTVLILDQKVQLEFDSKFRLFIKKMIKNKIIFENSSSAVNFLNKNYDNLENWWNSESNQRLLDQFCKVYCKRSTNLKLELKGIFKK